MSLTGARALAPVGAGALYVLFDSYIPVIILVALLPRLPSSRSCLSASPRCKSDYQ
jgi:hypothetical protein